MFRLAKICSRVRRCAVVKFGSTHTRKAPNHTLKRERVRKRRGDGGKTGTKKKNKARERVDALREKKKKKIDVLSQVLQA